MEGFVFALIAVGAFNTVIALLLSLVGYGGGFGENLAFSQCIGLTILALIHLGWRQFWPGAKPPTGPLAASGTMIGSNGGDVHRSTGSTGCTS